MCGIAGVVPVGDGAPAELETLRAMCDTIVHRGPDDEGLSVENGVALGMRRLAIIDLDGGRQPYVNEDGTVSAVFNGEIYNFRELRRDLEARGHRFRSATDGEVIVHLWEEYGPDFPRHLNGMFAIALHDRARRRVALVRDRLGIKPLFWAATATHVVFGSEVKALLASGLVPRDLDVDAVAQFLAWEYVPAPATLLRSVRKLEPGARIVLDLTGPGAGAVSPERWWALPEADPDPTRSDADWEDAVDAKLAETVRRRLVADVPLGAFLSGGVDSSLIVHAMGEGAKTCSIRFDDPTYDESGWAAKVADHLGVDHRVETIDPDVRDLFDRLMHFMDDPIGDFSIFPTYLVSKFAREGVTVALSGDGGDELFGGYETYLAQDKANAWERIPKLLRSGVFEPAIRRLRPRPAKKGLVNKAKRFVEGLEHDAALEHARWRVFAGEVARETLFTADAREAVSTPVAGHVVALLERAGAREPLDRQLYADVGSYLVDNCLVKVDRMSMAVSLEVRVPFLDHELVELAFRVPSRLKANGGSTKVLLKRVAARHVPRECVYRPKEGFSIPIKHWLNDELRPLMEDRLSAARLDRQGLFRSDTIERLKREHREGRENHSHVLWSLIVFQDWIDRWGAA